MNIRSVLVWHLGAVLFVGAAGAGTYHGIRNLHAQRAAMAEREAVVVVADAAVADATLTAATPAPVVATPAPARTVASALPVPPLPKAAPTVHTVAAKSHRVTRLAVSARRRVYVVAPASPEPPATYAYPAYSAYPPGAGYYPYYARYRYYYGAY
jgi:hypothetical protein